MHRTSANLVKIGEAAKTLGVSIDTLRRWEKSGKIFSLRTPGGTRLYNLNTLQEITHERPPLLNLSTKDILERLEETGELFRTTQNDSENQNISESDDQSFRNASHSPLARLASISAIILTSALIVGTLTILKPVLLPSHTQPNISDTIKPSNLGKDLTKVNDFLGNAVGRVLAITTTKPFLEINADTQINGNLNVLDQINNLTLEATPSANEFILQSGDTSLTVSDTIELDQNLSINITD